MSERHLPVRPNLDQLKHQAKDLLSRIRRGDPSAIEEFNTYHPSPTTADSVRLAEAQLALARSYQAPSWPRLVQACTLIDAIWRDDVEAVRELVQKNHLRRDPNLLKRTFTHDEIYPPDLGCHDEVLATHGTPLAGATLLHMCIDYDELDIARWLLEQGMDPDVKAAVDNEGFGGHTPLFSTVVSQPNFWMNYQKKTPVAPFTELLLKHNADPNVSASLRKQLHPGYGPKYDIEKMYEYRNVTPLSWGRRFHAKVFVSEPALELIEAHGGRE